MFMAILFASIYSDNVNNIIPACPLIEEIWNSLEVEFMLLIIWYRVPIYKEGNPVEYFLPSRNYFIERAVRYGFYTAVMLEHACFSYNEFF